MTRRVQCVKLGREADGLDSPPFPGEKGLEIFEKISKVAWQGWLGKQTILIKENKLHRFNPKAHDFPDEERTKFLFEGNNEMPEGYVPPAS
jgi:Fe-S cluster biosynthesis and repair protein YggX